MTAYGAFAQIYDALMDDFDYPAWADYYVGLLERAGVRPKTLCDCACGTGSLTVEFAKRGMRVTGADLSGEMLEVAAEKARENGVAAMFVRQDMCALTVPRPVDAMVCGCDGVNYLLTEERLSAFFDHAHAAIRPGGALAFDVSTLHKLRDVLGNGFFGEEREDVAYLWSNAWDDGKSTVRMDLTFFQREKSGLYRRFSETHVQRGYDAETLIQCLEKSGFRVLGVFGDQTFEAPGAEEMRMHLLAARE